MATQTMTVSASTASIQPPSIEMARGDLQNIREKFKGCKDSLSNKMIEWIDAALALEGSEEFLQQEAIQRIDDLREKILVNHDKAHTFANAMDLWANSVIPVTTVAVPAVTITSIIQQQQRLKTRAESQTALFEAVEARLRAQIELIAERSRQKANENVMAISERINGIEIAWEGKCNNALARLANAEHRAEQSERRVEVVEQRSLAVEAENREIRRQCDEMMAKRKSHCIIQ